MLRHSVRALALVSLLSACGGRTAPPPGASGAEVYDAQRCALCHGPEGEGARGGPALRDLGRRWTTEELVGFFVRPGDYLREDEALRTMATKYPMPMGSYKHLEEEHLRVLAEWLLTL